MNFSKAIWEEIKRGESNFSAIKGGEGVTRSIDSEFSAYFHLNGSFSHLDLIFGVSYKYVSDIVDHTLKNIPDFQNIRKEYKSGIMGLFYLKVGDFCSDADHLGIFCPQNSKVINISNAIEILNNVCDTYLFMANLDNALDYLFKNQILEIGDKFYIPAACIYANRYDLFEESSDFFLSNAKFRCGESYLLYKDKLRTMTKI